MTAEEFAVAFDQKLAETERGLWLAYDVYIADFQTGKAAETRLKAHGIALARELLASMQRPAAVTS